jgi:hypothetical protein
MAEQERYLGARALGLTVEWRLRFVATDARAVSTPGAVYIDIDGVAGPGVVLPTDAATHAQSAAEYLVRYPERVYHHLLGPRLERVARGDGVGDPRLVITLFLRRQLSLDGIAATWLVQRLVEDGELPALTPLLARWATESDFGRLGFGDSEALGLYAPHFGMQALMHAAGVDPDVTRRNTAILARGLDLITQVLSDLSQEDRRADSWWRTPTAARWTEQPRFADLKSLLDADREAWSADRAEADEDAIALPARFTDATHGEESAIERSLIFRRPPRSRFFKDWLRNEGFVLSVVPSETRESPYDPVREVYPRVMITVDARRARGSLRGLALQLEDLECRARRPHGRREEDVRPGPPRWNDGSCDNTDPWYDGRQHAHTLVETPRAGTLLPYARILETLRSGEFWHMPVVSGRVVRLWRVDGPPSPHTEPPTDTLWTASVRLNGAELDAPSRLVPVTLGAVRFDAEVLDVVDVRLEALVARPAGPGTPRSAELPCATFAGLTLRHGWADWPRVERLLARCPGLSGEHEVDLQPDELLHVGAQGVAIAQSHPQQGGDALVAAERTFLRATRARTNLDALRGELSRLARTDAAALDPHVAAAWLDAATECLTDTLDLAAARRGQAQRLAPLLSDFLRLDRLTDDVRELRSRLDQNLDRRADAIEEQNAKLLNGVLYLIGCAGVYQTVIAFATWNDFQHYRPELAGLTLGLLLPLLIARWRERERKRNAKE